MSLLNNISILLTQFYKENINHKKRVKKIICMSPKEDFIWIMIQKFQKVFQEQIDTIRKIFGIIVLQEKKIQKKRLIRNQLNTHILIKFKQNKKIGKSQGYLLIIQFQLINKSKPEKKNQVKRNVLKVLKNTFMKTHNIQVILYPELEHIILDYQSIKLKQTILIENFGRTNIKKMMIF